MLLKVILFCFLFSFVCSEDFYHLLGIERDADNVAIRRAFKKLALRLHPDKNPNDPEAHEKFVQLNRAYEVLKDEEMRKKYDTYGEAGLKDDEGMGGQYQSWTFYDQEFGIYDDDEDIITLGSSDFEQSVTTGELWFINFYSAQCSHCHDLAPTWREIAHSLHGVIRIGAVNCLDDWNLCSNEDIEAYPSLIVYPGRQKFRGKKTKENLIEFVLKFADANAKVLTGENFGQLIEPNQRYLLSICDSLDTAECIETVTLQKLDLLLRGILTLFSVDCEKQRQLCREHNFHNSGIFYYAANELSTNQPGTEISQLDPIEITKEVLKLLPALFEFDTGSWQQRRIQLTNNNAKPLLVVFVNSDSVPLEWRKLPFLLPDAEVGLVNCLRAAEVCNKMHIRKHPTFITMKVGKSYEYHYGRDHLADVVAFAKNSADSPVLALSPEDFPSPVIDSGVPFFVDFFAPWCPPCQHLLPEFRKASHLVSGVHFGTVDCTQHQQLCNTYDIRSYPTSVLYNHSKPHIFRGYHDAETIADFLRDILNPPVLMLTDSSFESHIREKPADELWIVDYFAPWCGPCQELAPEFNDVAKRFRGHKLVRVAQLDCEQFRSTCRSRGVRSYPTIRLYPAGVIGANTFYDYDNWFRDADSIANWVYQYLPSKVTTFHGDDIYSVLHDDADNWVVDFYAPWCGHCQVFAPVFQSVAETLEGYNVRFAKIDCDDYHYVCQQFGVNSYPSIRLFTGSQRSIYGEELSPDYSYLNYYLSGRFEKSQAEQLTSHDEL